MLSLKYLRVEPMPEKRYLLDLPDELLDEIVQHIYLGGGRFVRDVLPISLVCCRLRKAAAAILFHTLHVRLMKHCVDRRTFNLLLDVELSPYVASNVRHIQQHDGVDGIEDECEGLNLSNELVRAVALQALRLLQNARRLSVGCNRSPLLLLMQEAFPDKTFNIRIEGCHCPLSKCKDGQVFNKQHHFALAVPSRNARSTLHDYAFDCPGTVLALVWNQPKVSNLSDFDGLNLVRTFDKLQELHLRASSDSQLTSSEIPEMLPVMRDLRRLSLTGSGFCSETLKIVSKLDKLESLRLHAGSERIFHTQLRDHDFEGLPYLRLPNLKSLEIRYISKYLSIEHVVPSSLRHLRLEYQNRSDRLGAFDLRWIAKTAPDLECLELNIGSLENLWHPTAIAGVDVDVEVYRILDALSSFKKLQRLRLFPSYRQSTAGHLRFKQPIDDEQAVRIFNHLRRQCRNLQVLIISSSYLDYQSILDPYAQYVNDPIKWVARPSGKKTILITHQAKKNYHLEQIWEGERRLTMRNVRRYGRKPHFDEMEEWALPSYEFPFDEPLLWHSR